MKDLFSQEFYDELFSQLIAWSIETLPKLLLTLVLFFIVLRSIKMILRKMKKLIIDNVHSGNSENQLEKEKRANTLINITRGVLVVAMWLIFIMIFLRQLGLDIAPILAGAGIVGLAVGFGAQELVRDAISGFFMILENRVRTGDVAVVNGTGGLVENINLRTVTLRDLSGVVHTFQNGKINTLANMTKEWSAMVFDIGVAYKENVDDVIKTIHEVGDKMQGDSDFKDKFMDKIEVFGLDKFGDSAVVIKARIRTKPSEQWMVGREFNRRLKQVFDERGIEIPFPHRTIYWGDEIAPLKLTKTE